MDRSLVWLISICSFVLALFFVYLMLSTCMGPTLIRAARSYLAGDYDSRTRDNWDSGRGQGGYRGQAASSALRTGAGGWGFEMGRGGQEGYEMTSLGEDDDQM